MANPLATHERDTVEMNDNDLLAEQRSYYRARAPEYDEWWQRRGRFDRGEEQLLEWQRQVAVVDDALASFGATGSVLELAGGTGWWTERLVRTADRLTVVDSSPESWDGIPSWGRGWRRAQAGGAKPRQVWSGLWCVSATRLG